MAKESLRKAQSHADKAFPQNYLCHIPIPSPRRGGRPPLSLLSLFVPVLASAYLPLYLSVRVCVSLDMHVNLCFLPVALVLLLLLLLLAFLCPKAAQTNTHISPHIRACILIPQRKCVCVWVRVMWEDGDKTATVSCRCVLLNIVKQALAHR